MNRRDRRARDRKNGALWGDGVKQQQAFEAAVNYYRQEHLDGRDHGLPDPIAFAVFHGWIHPCRGEPNVVHKWGRKSAEAIDPHGAQMVPTGPVERPLVATPVDESQE